MFFGAFLVLSSCDYILGPDVPVGEENLTVTVGGGFSRALSSDVTGTFWYTFTFTGPDQLITKELEPGVESFRVSASLGEWTINAEAYMDAEKTIHVGTGSIVSYRVIAGLNSVKVPMTETEEYTAKVITGFSLGIPGELVVISEDTHSITVTVPFGTDITGLNPVVTHTGLGYAPAGNRDFTNPVTYTVSSADGLSREYRVTVAFTAADFVAMKWLTGTITPAITNSSGLTLETGLKVRAFSDPAYNNPIITDPPTVTVSGGSWALKVPVSVTDVYFKLEQNLIGWVYSGAATASGISTPIPDEGQTGIGLTMTIPAPVAHRAVGNGFYYSTLQDAINDSSNTASVTNPDTITLLNTIFIGGTPVPPNVSEPPLIIPAGKHVKLIHNGSPLSITRNADSLPSLITVEDGGSLEVGDTGDTVTAYITIDGNRSNYIANAALITVNGIFKMSGGDITGNAGPWDGGGVFVDYGGSFEMSGGTITGNTAGAGGGVYVNGGNFAMSGGTITGNTTDQGGGVFVVQGTFTMSGTAVVDAAAGNEVFLMNGNRIAISGNLTANPAAKIIYATAATPPSFGTQLLDGSSGDIAANYAKFLYNTDPPGRIDNLGKYCSGYSLGTPSPDLKSYFGILTSGTAGVTEVFNALHSLIAAPQGGDNFASIIQLGDYIDLPSLTIDSTPISDMPVTGGQLLRLIVVGINSFKANGLYTGVPNAPNHVVFQFQNMPVTHRMHSSNVNTMGYEDSEMRTYLTNSFLPGLKTAIGLTDDTILWAPTRYAANKGSGADGTQTIMDKLWLPTEREMFGSNTYSSTVYETAANQARLEYYVDNTKRAKYDSTNTVSWYWLASPHRGAVFDFCVSSNPIGANVHYAGTVGGCAPAFCVQ